MRYLTIKEIICATINYAYIQKFHYKRKFKHLYNALFNYLEWVINPSEVNKFQYKFDILLFTYETKFFNKLIGDAKYTDIFKKNKYKR